MQEYLENAFSLVGKTAVVTGGARGIGMAIATSLARAGSDVVIWDIQEALAKETAGRISAATGAKTWYYSSDITRKEEVKADAGKILAMVDNVNILVNNAGVQVRKPALEFTVEEWTRVIETHLSATFFISQAFVPHMAARGDGRIINLGSLNCVMAVPNIIAYTAAKSGIAGLTRSMCVDVGEYGYKYQRHRTRFCRNGIDEESFLQPGKTRLGDGENPDEAAR